MRIKLLPLFLAFLIFVQGCKTSDGIPEPYLADHAMVVSARAEASELALDTMRNGGNAFDAMVVTHLTLAVAYPFAGNLGGGGFLVYRLKDGSKGTLDFREKAPSAAHRDMYLDSLGNVIPDKSTLGATAVGVPGSLRGIYMAHKKFGKLPFEQLLDQAIALAENGVIVSENQAKSLNRYTEIFSELNGENSLFSRTFKGGDTLVQKALANTLKKIQEDGIDSFYGGELGKSLSDFIQEEGGYVTLEDLQDYQAVWRDPIEFNYKNLHVISMAPPSSGGVTLAQIMKMIEAHEPEQYAHHSVNMIQLLSEAEKRAYADRNYYLGDPDHVEIPMEVLLSSSYLDSRMEDFEFGQPVPSSEIQEGQINYAESMETTHYSIVDSEGNAIAVTTTLNGAYGSKLYSNELGFFLNNEMDDFSAKPGVPNMFGLTGAEANSIAPGKRMLSSMTPTIVEKDGELSMVVGTPGGSTIITSVLQTIINVYDYDMTMQQAVNAGRFHHQWLPDEIRMEPGRFSDEVIEELKERGYKVNLEQSPVIGKVDAILVREDGKLEAGADPRGDDSAKGY
ncbi:gamma-glutamyltransferase [Robertkochia marina]|uniref:Glutathione hydrolase proenzyme n=1 Tax=Robertkochia marina TaxID=1227945 RepID=A0A4S3M0J5_9FLAO|nr:gamma-glutamyltransferase [Robertkochia marina]THD67871.1 gamma-glutamyltransferase [Robertkochia marina]TRZ42090.1 gamma-glutamyltransferase [Robertkochia marina]